MVSPALLAFEQPTVGSMLKGRGVGAPSSMHCMKRPSRQPSAKIQSAVDVAAVIRITVIKQHVKAITCNGAGIRHGHNVKYIICLGQSLQDRHSAQAFSLSVNLRDL